MCGASPPSPAAPPPRPAGDGRECGHGEDECAQVGAGEAVEFVIRAGFEPERVVVDPDVLVLQLGREAAVFEW